MDQRKPNTVEGWGVFEDWDTLFWGDWVEELCDGVYI